MGEKLIVGPINKGFRNDRTAFVIDNDSFPTLINAYQWRGRVKRKRGTQFLGRLTRFFNSISTAYSSSSTFALVAGAGNLLTGFSLQTNGNIVPGSVSVTDTITGDVYTDLNQDGTLQGTPAGTGTINYATGTITITGGAGHLVSASFLYFPDLPVLGLEDFIESTNAFPGTIGFDTTYSYNVLTVEPYSIYDVSFYKNPAADGTNLPGYVPKTVWTPTTWNGQDYQQFWTVNYQGAMWTSNGINIPFSISDIGMQFKAITGMSITSATPTNGPSIVTLTIVGHGLVKGDFIFVNEVIYTAPNTTNSINFQTGYVVNVIDANNVSIEFPNAFLNGTYSTGGIAQYLTNRSSTTIDCLRWYDGDPTNGNAITPGFSQGLGWVNFAPPLSQSTYSIADTSPRQYYLVGARMIVPFKDRLLFIGAVIQASTGSPIYLQDKIIYSQNGTPYYTCSFTGDPNLATTVFFPILTPAVNLVTSPPVNETATASAYWEDQTGFGGFISAGVDQPMNTVSLNEDVLIVGLNTLQTRIVYTGNDIVPLNIFIINSELGSNSTFSTINMDQGVITRGSRGYIITNQTSAQRIDLEIPDEVFEIDLLNNGTERFCATRDFINEWIYFTYPGNNDENTSSYFPNTTLQYNYRDNSWAVFYESYTTYGFFRRQTGFTWATVGQTYPTWADWTDPWNSGESTLLQQQVIGGNQQGFVLIRGVGTGEGTSLYITGFSSSVVTSPEHMLNEGDYIIITGCIGSVGTQVNGKIFSVANPTTNTFTLDPGITSGTYFGGGVITKLFVPFIQTKQFPTAWGLGRKTRIGMQQYLLTKTANSQISLLIFLSQDDSNAYNDSPIVPANNVINNSLIYSTLLYTCPESTNLGLTQANTNLQQLTQLSSNGDSSNSQQQIWHRINTSLIGDTVQLGFTMSDSQMRALNVDGASLTITGTTQSNPCVLTCTNNFSTGQLLQINGVLGMTQLNGNTYIVITANSTSITIEVDSTGFGMYISGGTVTPVAPLNQTSEIELHNFILDVNPSQLLA